MGSVRNRDNARGFTLAEVLVVLLVIGLAAGFAYARFDSDPRREVEREARRFATALEHAAALAQWRNETLGVSAGGAAYRFWRRVPSAEGDQWAAFTSDEILAPRALPERLSAAAREYAGRGVPADAILPLAPSGRNEPYAFEIASPEWRVLLFADPLNRVAVAAPIPR
ncbi:MAG TPA: prepilin-type N-terminal cleavage/methylation domain-containing protein [Casimicrobiaceae bacterium]|nr:prepilin-type N-terminal cleavage/methylation domain-containing protein [Casimicrobiaceae bacterium]